MLVWSLIVQIFTGAVVVVDMNSEAECEEVLAKSKSHQMTIIVKGERVLVSKAFGCAMRRTKEGEESLS